MSEQPNNSNEEMLKRFERDEKLMWPESPKSNTRERRIYKEYLRTLVDNQSFIDASRKTEKTISKAKTRYENKEKITTFVLRFLILALLTGAGIEGYKITNNYDNSTTKSVATNVGIHACMLVILMFVAISMLTITGTNDTDKKYAETPEVFFNRLIVRYFDVLKKMYPELSEKYLQICNQPDMEMARVIYSLLVVNMRTSDVKKLTEIALSVNGDIVKDKINTMYNIESGIRQATQIIEKTLIIHPELRTIVKDAYMAKIPATFFVVNAKNQSKVRGI